MNDYNPRGEEQEPSKKFCCSHDVFIRSDQFNNKFANAPWYYPEQGAC